ncbi:exonuclease SbcCD subunit D [Paenibacillus cymbidii]|uniref:exonuclease SbcCD subunit D n=1 Tax=Paenibacillus cymbidii TaxID=1639034 RepID=UPI001081B512|nr:exonuclease SbcCD subunit D [Paenibacillus cymbidii]
MKFFHTADWHLGKLVQGVYMTDDQRHALEQFVRDVERERPDAVVIAGDLYDRAVPPAEAVALLDELLARIVIGLGTPVLAIAGNHDSPDRLDFATRMMESRGLHLSGRLTRDIRTVALQDEFGPVHFHLVPYADPAIVRYIEENEEIRTHDDAMKATVAAISGSMDEGARHVFVGHAFVTPYGEPEANTSDAERPLSIGGAEYVRADHFKPFHYTALGHLHAAHAVVGDNIRYSGSPLKYSIDEERHEKGYYIVEMNGAGEVRVDKRTLAPLRDMRRVVGTMAEIAAHAPSDDYVFVTLRDETPVLYPMEKVRSVYPNALHVDRSVQRGEADEEGATAAGSGESRRKADPVSLFAAFYREVTGQPIDDGKLALFRETFAEALRLEEEAG